PAGIRLVLVDAKTGLRAASGQKGVVLEAFKPGSAPPAYDPTLVAGTDVIDGTQQPPPDSGQAVMRSGTGGLY
ncbi:hypothetical protein H8A99_28200, partial [Bradyrhizobium sp. Arg68]